MLPQDNIDTILRWQANNPDFEIWLWIDPRTAPPEYEAYYNRIFFERAHALGLVIDQSKILFKDIEEPQERHAMQDGQQPFLVSTPYIRHEIDRIKPNYGVSSDLLRYRILYKYGGAYFDSDVSHGNVSLQESGIFDEDHEHPVLYVIPTSQMDELITHVTQIKINSRFLFNFDDIMRIPFFACPRARVKLT